MMDPITQYQVGQKLEQTAGRSEHQSSAIGMAVHASVCILAAELWWGSSIHLLVFIAVVVVPFLVLRLVAWADRDG